MNLKYSYWYFDSVLSDDVCDKIIEVGLEQMYETQRTHGDNAIKGTTGDHRQKDSITEDDSISPISAAHYTNHALKRRNIDASKTYVRDSRVSWLDHGWLYDIVRPYVDSANQSAGWNWHWDYIETMQFTKYEIGQFYGWHADSTPEPYEFFDPEIHETLKDKDGNTVYDINDRPVPPDGHYTENLEMVGKIRKLSVTINLTSPKNYKGGNLRFDFGPHADIKRYHTCKEILPRGSIIVFPSFEYHQVTPVTEGTRYSLVAWCLGRPFV